MTTSSKVGHATLMETKRCWNRSMMNERQRKTSSFHLWFISVQICSGCLYASGCYCYRKKQGHSLLHTNIYHIFDIYLTVYIWETLYYVCSLEIIDALRTWQSRLYTHIPYSSKFCMNHHYTLLCNEYISNLMCNVKSIFHAACWWML